MNYTTGSVLVSNSPACKAGKRLSLDNTKVKILRLILF